MKRKVVLIVLLLLFVVSTVTWKVISVGASNILTEKEIKKIALQYTEGTIESIKLKDKDYFIQMKKNDVQYKLVLRAKTGELVEKSIISLNNHHLSSSKNLKEAKKIALAEVKGTIISVKLKKDGKLYAIQLARGKYLYDLIISISRNKVTNMNKYKNLHLENKISKEHAKKIALDYLDGKVVSSKWFKKEGIYYFKIQKNSENYALYVDPYKKSVIEVVNKGKVKNKKTVKNKKELAESTALKTTPGNIVKSKLENGVYQFEISTNNGTKYVHIDANTGQIVNEQNTPPEQDREGISSEEAKSYALGAVNGTVQSVELDNDQTNYLVRIVLNDVNYLVKVNRINATVESTIISTNDSENSTNDKDMTSELNEEVKDNNEIQPVEENKLLSEQEISAKALASVAGVVTKIVLNSTTYEVVVKDDTLEYTLKIDGYSGEIMSNSKKYIE